MDKDPNRELLKIREYAEIAFDKLIVLLAGGTLAFSLGFADNIKEISDKNTVLLRLACLVFSLTLVFILFSHVTYRVSVDLD